jgi:glycosyltransferase involved in cell wall biosynthesis
MTVRLETLPRAVERDLARTRGVHVSLLTGGADRPYAFGLSTALFRLKLRLDVISGDDLDVQEFNGAPNVAVLAFWRHQPGAGTLAKAWSVARYYARLIRYAWVAQAPVFHILWNNKFQAFDRVVLMLYYRWLGKRIVLTAHNVNTSARDAKDTWFNRWTLRFQYRCCDHVFVHTDLMKQELVAGFGVNPGDVTVIPFGINNAVPRTDVTSAEARRRLGIAQNDRTILFFGNIAPYKGLEYLIEAFRQLRSVDSTYRLVVAGPIKKGFETYWKTLRSSIGDCPEEDGIILRTEFVPDEETELYFKAADVLALPYVSIFQSGVLFLGYSFGLPVIAADVGSLRDAIVEGETGLVCRSQDSGDLAATIEAYFSSDLFRTLDTRRQAIRDYAEATYSWDAVANTTRDVYSRLLTLNGSGR